jgi:hypothetical protein
VAQACTQVDEGGHGVADVLKRVNVPVGCLGGGGAAAESGGSRSSQLLVEAAGCCQEQAAAAMSTCWLPCLVCSPSDTHISVRLAVFLSMPPGATANTPFCRNRTQQQQQTGQSGQVIVVCAVYVLQAGGCDTAVAH